MLAFWSELSCHAAAQDILNLSQASRYVVCERGSGFEADYFCAAVVERPNGSKLFVSDHLGKLREWNVSGDLLDGALIRLAALPRETGACSSETTYQSDAALARAHGMDSIRVRWRGPNSGGTITAAFVPGGSWLRSTGNPRADDVLKAARTIFRELVRAPVTEPIAVHRVD